MRRHRRRAHFTALRALLPRSRGPLLQRIGRGHTPASPIAELREEIGERLTVRVEGWRHGLAVRRLPTARVLVVAAGAPATAAAAAAVDVAVDLSRCARRALIVRCAVASGWWLGLLCLTLLVFLLRVQVLLLRVAALPAQLPGADEVVKEPALQFEAGSDADGEVVEVHAVAVLVGQQQ